MHTWWKGSALHVLPSCTPGVPRYLTPQCPGLPPPLLPATTAHTDRSSRRHAGCSAGGPVCCGALAAAAKLHRAALRRGARLRRVDGAARTAGGGCALALEPWLRVHAPVPSPCPAPYTSARIRAIPPAQPGSATSTCAVDITTTCAVYKPCCFLNATSDCACRVRQGHRADSVRQ